MDLLYATQSEARSRSRSRMPTVTRSDSMSDSDDGEVIKRSQHEPSEFAVIFDRHAADVYRFLARRVGGHLADDLTGQTMLLAFERRYTFDDRYTSCLPWLYGMANNLIRQHRRTQVRRDRALDRLRRNTSAEHSGAVQSRFSAFAAAHTLRSAIARLSRKEHDILLLIAWEELSYEEVSLALQIPLGTVRSKIHRVRRKLRTALDQENSPDTSKDTP